ncbi:hypothetical protein B0T16DRAFT_461702 [Cercophora newfieldiana]|uniref:Uncharacterized protein n=1 Tax=Cercophora newfieldiana TaxID=92897 RepID=A0AA40CLB3_9PEZI|nr:hypothetical protein B0T16DRAFT_461702 [Cercophora newfieldiana]
MEERKEEPQGLISKFWRRALTTLRPAAAKPLISSTPSWTPANRFPEDGTLQRSLSFGPRPSVEPPHVFDYQFAKSPAVSAAPSIASYQQRHYRPAEGNEEDLQPIEEVDTPPRTSFDDSYMANDRTQEAVTSEALEPRPEPDYKPPNDSQLDSTTALAQGTDENRVEPPLRRPASFTASTLEEALRVSSSQPLGPPDFEGDEAKLSRNSTMPMEDLIPPVSTLPRGSSSIGGHLSPNPSRHGSFGFTPSAAPGLAPDSNRPAYYNTSRPTCSLNLVCYRSGARGCALQQIQCILASKFQTEESFQAAMKTNNHLIHTDDEFFREMQRLYKYEMCGFFRRYFSLKTLREFRVLAYTPITRPTVVPFDTFVLQEMMYAYRNPDRLFHGTDDWIKWVFRLRRKEKRHALEFVEGWNTTRIAVSGSVPWLASCLVGIIWTAMGGDAQTAFTVASFILTSSSVILALLAIISSIESSR